MAAELAASKSQAAELAVAKDKLDKSLQQLQASSAKAYKALEDKTAKAYKELEEKSSKAHSATEKRLTRAYEECEAKATAAAKSALQAKYSSLDAVRAGLGFESARYLLLLQTDNLWKGHIKAMNYVKEFAGLKVYAQQYPLDVYREEGLKLYDRMQVSLLQNTVFSFFAYRQK